MFQLESTWYASLNICMQMGSVFDVSSDKLESFSMFDFKQNEQVTICYGAHNNGDFLIHNGFIVQSNSHGDQVNLSLGKSFFDCY